MSSVSSVKLWGFEAWRRHMQQLSVRYDTIHFLITMPFNTILQFCYVSKLLMLCPYAVIAPLPTHFYPFSTSLSIFKDVADADLPRSSPVPLMCLLREHSCLCIFCLFLLKVHSIVLNRKVEILGSVEQDIRSEWPVPGDVCDLRIWCTFSQGLDWTFITLICSKLKIFFRVLCFSLEKVNLFLRLVDPRCDSVPRVTIIRYASYLLFTAETAKAAVIVQQFYYLNLFHIMYCLVSVQLID